MEREIISFDYAIKTPEQRAEYERNKIIDMSQKSQLYTAELRVLEKTVIRGHNKGHSKLTVGIFGAAEKKSNTASPQ